MVKRQKQHKYFYYAVIDHLWKYWIVIYDKYMKYNNSDPAKTMGIIREGLYKLVATAIAKNSNKPDF